MAVHGTVIRPRGGRPQKPPGEALAPVTSWIEEWILDVIYERARRGHISTSAYLCALVKKALQSEGVSLQNKPESVQKTHV